MIEFQDFLQSVCDAVPRIQADPLEYALTLTRPAGLLIECGVFEGRTISNIARSAPAQTVYGFDSFEGLPEDWGRPDADFPKGCFARPRESYGLPGVPPNVQLVIGWFTDTLPLFVSQHANERIGLLHIDCDLYSSTRTVLETLHPLFADDTVVVFDELVNYPTYENHEIKALYELLCAHPELRIEWIGCRGPIIRHPVRDNGAWDQPVALRIKKGES